MLQRLDAGDVATNDANPARLFELVGRGLETQVERLALQIAQLLVELVVGLRLEIVDPGHRHAPRCEVSPSRSEEHTSELQSLMRSSYAVLCLKNKKKKIKP